MTPLAKDEPTGPRGEGYRRMTEASTARRAGTPDDSGNGRALLMGPDESFITSSDFLMDGGVTAAYWYGELAPRCAPGLGTKQLVADIVQCGPCTLSHSESVT
jgi:hypothetical protein